MNNLEPVPSEKLETVDYGLITPSGQIFDCNYANHCTLASQLVEAGLMPENDRDEDHHGAVHISDGKFDYVMTGIRNPNGFYGQYLHVTQRQLDAMLDYTIAKNMQFDFSKLEVI